VKFAYFGIPHTGGTWTVFVTLRDGLARHGIEVVWLGSGAKAAQAAEPSWGASPEIGGVVAGHTDDELTRARALADHITTQGIDGVFVNVLAGNVETNLVRYLDSHILRVMIVHNITPGTYDAASAVRDYVHATVGVSPRIREDLVSRRGFDDNRTVTIPNGIDVSSFHVAQCPPVSSGSLRLLFLGRVKDQDKGVFWLASILAELADCDVLMSIAGDGPDLAELKRRMAPFAERVTFLGRIPAAQVPGIVSQHDVLVFPSRFEGLGLSLIEAMAAGCVPVATLLRGVTDFVVQDGETGFLFPIGDVVAAANAIRRLAANRILLQRMSIASRQSMAERFALTTMAESYARIVAEMISDPPSIAQPLEIARWRYPRGLRPSFRSRLPVPLKNFLRGWRERLAV
jgi:glycosyltransferase involved in cell wall biosynthesis